MTVLPGLEPYAPTVDEMIGEARGIVTAAKAEYHPISTVLLFSGGNDSLVLLDVLSDMADVVFHVETGIGIPETDVFAEKVGASYGLPYVVERPPVSYEELVLGRWRGMPGPGAHLYTYNRLKERCVEALLRRIKTRERQRVLLLTGVRRAESRRRMGYTDPVNRKGGQVWVNPLLNWSNQTISEYRTERRLPINPVSEHLHMSGECLCGAMASQNHHRQERAQIRFFYPDFDARLSALEQQCRDRGFRYCEWGMARPTVKREISGQATFEFAPMCTSCVYRHETNP